MTDRAELSGVEILLVEDSPDDRELTVRALRRSGIVNPIEVVADGEEALDYLLAQGRYSHRDVNHRPRLVLLDLKLPKVSGVEVLRRLRSDERMRTLPIVVLTSSRESRDLAECYELGVNSYIVKPVGFEQFIEAIGTVGLYWLLLNEHPDG